MVAERAVGQGLADLRAELGVKFFGMDSKLNNLQDSQNKLKELEEGLEDLSDQMTQAFKNNNALLRNEIKAMAGDFIQNAQNESNKNKQENAAIFEQSMKAQQGETKKQIEELEKKHKFNTREH